jgi:predicted RNA-binding protein with TRAM domain
MMMATATATSFSAPVAAAAEAATALLRDVPDRLRLTPDLEAYPIRDVALREIDATQGAPVKEAETSVRLEDVAKSHSGTVGSVAFVVRRPGCQLCREHGQHVRRVRENRSRAVGSSRAALRLR